MSPWYPLSHLQFSFEQRFVFLMKLFLKLALSAPYENLLM